MSTKRILHIGIAPRGYIHAHILKIANGSWRLESNEPKVWLTSMEALLHVLSKQNMLLTEMIGRADPRSVTELAQLVGRKKSNVLRSLKTLRDFEIVEYEEGERGRKAPRVKYDDFRIDGTFGSYEKAA